MHRFVLILLLLDVVNLDNFSSTFILTPRGTRFQPANTVELLRTFIANRLIDCTMKCNNDVHCRTIDFDSMSKQCRHFEGEISTGLIITSNSSKSIVGGIIYKSHHYVSYNKTSDQCRLDRYVVVNSSSNLCTCPIRTFWNGSMCLNQLYSGSICSSDDWCRVDLGLSCAMSHHICSSYQRSTALEYSTMDSSFALTNIINSTPMKTSVPVTSISTVADTTSYSIIINYNDTYPAPVTSPNAAAQLYGVNLLINGDGETGPCNQRDDIIHPTQWSYVGDITQTAYTSTGSAVPLDIYSPGPSNRGNCYFFGFFGSITTMSQSINLFPYATAIASGNVSFTLSAWLGSYGDQTDYADVSVKFLNVAYQSVGSQIKIGPVLDSDRNYITSLLFRQRSGMVPVNTRYMTVIVAAYWFDGYHNDGCVDNISLVLKRS